MPSLEPSIIVHLLKKHADTHFPLFIETGTNAADTTRAMTPLFERVFTIELSDELYARNLVYKSSYPTIEFIHGDSAVELNRLLPTIHQPAVFFLDGHWSSGNTARGPKDCPLMEEFQSIMTYMKHECIIIVDDYRLFGLGPHNHTLNEDWSDITKESLLSVVSSRLITDYHLPSHITLTDRWVLELSEKKN